MSSWVGEQTIPKLRKSDPGMIHSHRDKNMNEVPCRPCWGLFSCRVALCLPSWRSTSCSGAVGAPPLQSQAECCWGGVCSFSQVTTRSCQCRTYTTVTDCVRTKEPLSCLLGNCSDWTPEASDGSALVSFAPHTFWVSVLKQFLHLICPIQLDRNSHPLGWDQPLLFRCEQAFLFLWGLPCFTQDIPTVQCCFQHLSARLEHPKGFIFPYKIDFLYLVSSESSSQHL